MSRVGAAAQMMTRRRGGALLHDRILAVSGTMTIGGLFLAHLDNLTLVTGDASVWDDLSGLGNDYLQSTASARPPYDATGLNGGPTLTFDLARYMQTASTIALSGAAALAHICVAETTAGGLKTLTDYGTNTATGFAGVQSGNRGEARARQNTGGLRSRARVNTGYQAAGGTIATFTWDSALSTNEAEVRKDGVNVTASRPVNDNLPASGDFAMTLGAKGNAGDKLDGALAAHVFLFGSLDVTQIADIETELIAALAAGDYQS